VHFDHVYDFVLLVAASDGIGEYKFYDSYVENDNFNNIVLTGYDGTDCPDGIDVFKIIVFKVSITTNNRDAYM